MPRSPWSSFRFPRREDVDRSNAGRMKFLNSKVERYTTIDGGTNQDLSQREKILGNFRAVQTLELRQDAQVILSLILFSLKTYPIA